MRRALIKRRTAETVITMRLGIEGRGRYAISTGIRFLDHMLELVARHGAFDLQIDAVGDLDVDQHHTVEDVGIALGEAVAKAIDHWDSDKRVAVVASGGLSHFLVDEEIDQMAIKGMREKDADLLASMPRYRLNSGSSEILNWVTAAGALEHLDMELVDYVPVYRSPAGTGGGWGFALWR